MRPAVSVQPRQASSPSHSSRQCLVWRRCIGQRGWRTGGSATVAALVPAATRARREGRMLRTSARCALVLLVVGIIVAGCGSEETSAPSENASESSKFESLYKEVSKLEGEEALEFFESLPEKGVKGTEVIDFFVDLPI